MSSHPTTARYDMRAIPQVVKVKLADFSYVGSTSMSAALQDGQIIDAVISGKYVHAG